MDISEVPGCHLLSFVLDGFSVRVAKITPRIGVSRTHSLFFYFNLFLLNELWPYYQKDANQITLNRITLWSLALQKFEALNHILLIVNLSLNQTLQTFLLYERQTWMTRLILAISLWGLSSFNLKRFYYSCTWSRSSCDRRTSFCMGCTSRKLCRFLLMFLTGYTSLIFLLLLPPSITLFVFMQFLILLHLK